jgi:hypothetical protein
MIQATLDLDCSNLNLIPRFFSGGKLCLVWVLDQTMKPEAIKGMEKTMHVVA